MTKISNKAFITGANLFTPVLLTVSILITPFVFSISVPDPALSPRLQFFSIAVFSLSLIWVILYVRNKEIFDISVLRRNIFKFYLGYIIIAAISIGFATNLSEGIFEWFKVFVFFVFFCLMSLSLTRIKNFPDIVSKFVIIFTILIALRGFYEIFSIASIGGLNHQNSYFIRAFSSHRNLYSQILFLTLSFTLYGIFSLRSYWRIASIVGSIMALILITLLLTRSVWVAFIISLIVLFIILFKFWRAFSINRKTVRYLFIFLAITIIIIVSGIFLYAKFGGAEVFKKQTYWIENYKISSSLERVELWKKTIQISRDHPITGVGMGNWKFILPSYGLKNLRSETGELHFQRPHNDFLWVLSENGITGLIFYLLIFLSFFYYVIKTIRNSDIYKDKLLALTMNFGVTGYMIIALFSFPKERIEHQIFLLIILTIITIKYHTTNKLPAIKNKIHLNVFVIPAFILLLAGIYLASSRKSSEKHIAKAYEYRKMQKWTKEIAEIDLALSPFTTVDAYATPLTWYRGEANFMLNNANKALYDFRQAYKIHPNHLHVLNNLGTCYELNGNREPAKKLYLKALKISPYFEESLLNLCAIYYSENKIDSAYQMIRKVDTTSANTRYNKFLHVILRTKIDEFRNSLDEHQLNKTLERIRNDFGWMQKIHIASIKDTIDIKKQLLLDSVFLLESVDSTISSEESHRLKNKFNL
ncbi:MAG: O-antigen ligase family protein [Bacteroidales bacterium]|nr:O-antigen ligase family protein [Bacteroidales bacterium]